MDDFVTLWVVEPSDRSLACTVVQNESADWSGAIVAARSAGDLVYEPNVLA